MKREWNLRDCRRSLTLLHESGRGRNLGRIRLFHPVNLERGYSLIEIRSPREVLADE